MAQHFALNSVATDLLYKGELVLAGFKMTENTMKRAKKVERMENVISMSGMFGGVRLEDFYSNVIPFAKSNVSLRKPLQIKNFKTF